MTMKTMKKIAAFKLMTEKFGAWKTWSRAEHLAYGLIRGVEHARIERCSNDNPPMYQVARHLWDMNAFEEHEAPAKDGKYHSVPSEIYSAVNEMIVWVKKTPRSKTIASECVEELDSSTVVSSGRVLLGGEVA